MLTIRNKENLRYKPVGKLNFYVDRMKDIFDLEPDGSGGFKPVNHKYQIDITNRTYTITITLERTASHTIHNDTHRYYKLHSSTGNILYLEQSDIRNIDTFINKLNEVSMAKFK
jgi:hypothetical protein